MKKITSLLLVSGLVLSIGCATVANTTSADAATVISQSTYEKTMSFTKDDLKNATGITLTSKLTVINSMYNSLKDSKVWVKLGYSSTDAKRIAQRVELSNYQTIGILEDIANNQKLEFKVVTITKPNYKNVDLGTVGTKDQSTTPSEDPATGETETTTPNEDPAKTPLSSLVKEIEIDIEYKKKDIEIDYDVKSDGRVKAEVENELTGSKVKDAQAQKIVEELFSGLDAKTSSKEEIQNHILTKLNAPKDGLKKFEFKVKFADKSKVDFKIK